MVATQVVRVWPTYAGFAASAAAAASSFGLAANFVIACAELTRRGLAGGAEARERGVVPHHREAELPQLHERGGEFVDGVVGARHASCGRPALRAVSVKSA